MFSCKICCPFSVLTDNFKSSLIEGVTFCLKYALSAICLLQLSSTFWETPSHVTRTSFDFRVMTYCWMMNSRYLSSVFIELLYYCWAKSVSFSWLDKLGKLTLTALFYRIYCLCLQRVPCSFWFTLLLYSVSSFLSVLFIVCLRCAILLFCVQFHFALKMMFDLLRQNLWARARTGSQFFLPK